MPNLSVIMPARNAEQYVATAVRSTLRALPQDSELIVLDDASSDATSEILSRFADRRFRVLRGSERVGVAAGLQQLIDQSDSQYVARMDADDVSLPGRFTWQLRHVDSGACDFSFSSIIRLNGSKPGRPSLSVPISTEAMPLHLAIHNPLCHPTMLATRAAITAAGGYRNVAAEDHDLWLRAISTGHRLARTSLPLLAYRQHERQVSSSRGFVTHALSEEAFRRTYRNFVLDRFRMEPSWMRALWPGTGETVARDEQLALRVLASAIEEHSNRLGRVQKYILGRTVRHLTQRMRDLDV